MLLCKKTHKIPVVTCMTPDKYLLGGFDLIFSPLHDKTPEAENIIKTIGPPNTNSNEGSHSFDRVLILVGGIDKKSHHWDNEEIVEEIEKLVVFDQSKTYTISSSPRTPQITLEYLKRIADKFENVSFFDFADTPRGWVEDQYKCSSHVWVTSDSISMVYEALSSGCRVGIIPVKWNSKNNKFRISEEYLMENKLIVDSRTYMSGTADRLKVSLLNEAERCADIVIRRFQWND